MIEVLAHAEILKRKSSRPSTLSIEDQLLLTLTYLKSHCTQLEFSASYHMAESNVNRTIKKVENALMDSRRFTLPKRQPLEDENFNWVIMDLTDTPIERPKKQRCFYSAKRKYHTLKTQVLYHPHSKQIVSIKIGKGRQDNMSVAKASTQKLSLYHYIMSDLGY